MAFDFAARRDHVRTTTARSEAGESGAPWLLVTDLINVRYLSGFTGSNAALLLGPTAQSDAIATDGRYLSQVAQQAPDLTAVIERDVAPALLARADGPIAFEAHVLSVADYDRLREVTPHPLVATTGRVEAARIVKDDAEVELLRRACEVSDQALAALVADGWLRPGVSERAVGRALENLMFDHGADGVAFETIVAAGANSAIPHHRPTDAVIEHGDFVKIDFGALVAGYHADITRTFVIGKVSDWQREIYDLVAHAQRVGRKALTVDADCRAPDDAARAVIVDGGYGDYFVHGLGHGVGLEIHEAPTISARGTGRLLGGACVTVEPGVYLPGRGGVRIEDTLVVRPDGPDLLTRTSKDLSVL